jgi:hypothetical protein
MKVIHNLLTMEELNSLRTLSKTCHFSVGGKGYTYGTVQGFGFSKGVPDAIFKKFMDVSELTPPFNGRSIQQFLCYEKGGINTPHKDWVYDTTFTHQRRNGEPDCVSLFRVNAVLTQATKGGELIVDGEEVKLVEGDVFVFRPELIEHEVKEILEGSRTIFTIGFHHKEPVRLLPRILA